MASFNHPPPDAIHSSIVHKIFEFYKIIYINGKKLSKGDKLGIRAKTEQFCLSSFRLSIEAALTAKNRKLPIIEKLQIEIEIIKQFIRLEMEIGIIQNNNYLLWQEKLQEISRMTSGWIKYIEKKEP